MKSIITHTVLSYLPYPELSALSSPHVHRPVSATEGSGLGSREGMAGDLRERGDHD